MLYRIDLETLLLLLDNSTGILQAPLTIPKIKGACQVQLDLVEGRIASCLITNERNGTLFLGEDAFKMVQKEVLQWTYTPIPPSTRIPMTIPPSTQSLPILPSSVPVRSRWIDQKERTSWMFLHRAIFNLANGSTSIERMIRVLKQDPKVVVKAVSELIESGAIALNNSQESSTRNLSSRFDDKTTH